MGCCMSTCRLAALFKTETATVSSSSSSFPSDVFSFDEHLSVRQQKIERDDEGSLDKTSSIERSLSNKTSIENESSIISGNPDTPSGLRIRSRNDQSQVCDFKAVKENYNEDDSNTPKIAKRFSDSAPTEHCKSSSSWSTSSLKSSSQGSADINDVQDVLKDTQSYNASGTSDQANLEKLDEKNDTVEFGQPSEAEEDLLESKKVTMASPNATRNNNGDDKPPISKADSRNPSSPPSHGVLLQHAEVVVVDIPLDDISEEGGVGSSSSSSFSSKEFAEHLCDEEEATMNGFNGETNHGYVPIEGEEIQSIQNVQDQLFEELTKRLGDGQSNIEEVGSDNMDGKEGHCGDARRNVKLKMEASDPDIRHPTVKSVSVELGAPMKQRSSFYAQIDPSV